MIRKTLITTLCLLMIAGCNGVEQPGKQAGAKKKSCMPNDLYRKELLACHAITEEKYRKECGNKLSGVSPCEKVHSFDFNG